MNGSTPRRFARCGATIVLLLAGAALLAACGGTSNGGKTATAAAKIGGAAGATKAPTTATASATKSPMTPMTSATPGGGTAAAGAALQVGNNPRLLNFLTDSKGITLYIFKDDVANNGKSAAEALAAMWPPLTADAPPAKPVGATGEFAIITRADGKKQVTYNGLPLYYYIGDKTAGDTKGQGIGRVWFVVAP